MKIPLYRILLTGCPRRLLRFANWFKSFDHNYTVSPDNHHPYIIFLIAIELQRVVNHQIHKLVEATKGADHNPVCIQLYLKLLVHVLLQIGRLTGSAHGELGWVREVKKEV
eukprot:TRINITY_DN24866_c0_g1_i1.p1 TRINITY_DN24866_c0_g1~~TRINITY_DN24866_c0_g1_i1.p1  ORF type:complete len:111 (+),score=10.86 TRINITY_DN24866_c0_g1_i1:273-605(+)